ncbi:carbohydrate ABC transporter permease [Actinomyces howellii]|uniref:sn-glycerol-3-phosphate transport system permease protein ugpA n=1 Tax=Actinomyces howellii TaxID=52771 RepID=A0A448HIN7_9ACTO|nr:sugar ABC transporter permease [Actinomyces howellii]VEG29442.1 sn-glycerol-3-phosphate transport system permease protein ugpA [Actinomyces howellii]
MSAPDAAASRDAGRARPPIAGALRRALVPYAYLSPTVVLLLVLMAVPIVMVVGYSLMDAVITSRQSQFVGLDNYVEVLTSESFRTALRNTLVFVVVSVVAHMIIGLGFAMLLNSQAVSPVTRAVFRTIFVLPWLLTVAIIAILWRLLLNPNGVVNAVLSAVGLVSGQYEWLADPDRALAVVTFINIWSGYPFFMISILAGLQGIPRDLYEAAEVDGAGPVRRFWSITLPQLRPIIISMALLDFIWTSQQFALIWMTTGGGPLSRTEMLSTFTYKMAFAEYDFSGASASAVIILLLSMVLACFYVRSQKARD